jgi:hypothetical protein
MDLKLTSTIDASGRPDTISKWEADFRYPHKQRTMTMDDSNDSWTSDHSNAWGCGADNIVPAEANYEHPSFDSSFDYGGGSTFGD